MNEAVKILFEITELWLEFKACLKQESKGGLYVLYPCIRNIWTYVVIQQMRTDKICFVIQLHVSVAFATIVGVLYKNTDKIEQFPKLHK
jgi:hypothetical protein